MRRFLDTLYVASGALAAAFILAIALLVMAQVSLNIVDRIAIAVNGSALGLTIPSYSDFTGFFLAAASFLALAHTLRSGDHIRVTLLTSRFSVRTSRLLDIVAVGVALIATVFVTWFCIALVIESYEYGDMSSGMVAVPIWIPQSFVAVGTLILAIALADELHAQLGGQPPSWTDKQTKLMNEGDDS